LKSRFTATKNFGKHKRKNVGGGNYLQQCFESFKDICEKKYGTRFDLPAIEQAVKKFRSHREPLTFEDLQKFESPEHWWFAKNWVFPPEHHVRNALELKPFEFWLLPGKERKEHDVIKSLVEIFKSIELVSIILRFIRPEHYGIISPPVEFVLDVRRGKDSTETYLNYLGNLRQVRDHYGFCKASEADMALWVLYERCFGKYIDSATQEAYRGDVFLRRLRAKNLLADFLQSYSYVELADSLLPVNLQLAAQMAGIAFEKIVRETGTKELGYGNYDQDLESLIEQLHDRGKIDPLDHGKWQAHRRTRNKAIHGATLPGRKEVELLIETLKKKLNSD
jgi:hypothetical protein